MNSNQVIFTNQYYETFAEAAKHSINEIKDGDELWVNVKLDKPVVEYAISWKDSDADGNVIESQTMIMVICGQNASSSYGNSFASDKLFLKGGDQYNKNYLTFLDVSSTDTEFSLCLSSYKKRKSSKIVLEAVGNGVPGKWANEIRFFRGVRFDEEPHFASAPLLCNVEDGIAKYKKAFADYKERMAKGDVEDNQLPPVGAFYDTKLDAQIRKEALDLSIHTTKLYFTQDSWKEYEDDNYLVKKIYRKVHAVVAYSKDEECFYAMVDATQHFIAGAWQEPVIEIYNRDTPISCDKVS